VNPSRRPEPIDGERLKIRFPEQGRSARARLVSRDGERWRLVVQSAFEVPDHTACVSVQFRRSDAAYEYEGCLIQTAPDPSRAAGDRAMPEGLEGGVMPGGTERIFLVTDPTPRRLQRREYFRMRVRLPFMVEGVIDPPAIDPPSPRCLQLVDLSAGGCCCRDPEGTLQAGLVYRVRLMLEAGAALVLHARVVRRARMRQGPVAGLHFPDLRDCDRERIMSALFEEYRRQRRRSLETINQSLEPRLPVG